MFKKKYLWMLITLVIFSLSLLNIKLVTADAQINGNNDMFISTATEENIVMDESGSINLITFSDNLNRKSSNCPPDSPNCGGSGT